MSSLTQIRQTFLDFFAQNDHRIVASAPLVPQNDPTLMFVNAGMVPFKDIFTGKETPKGLRATSSQKCVRAGGKHNDLDNVGYTARHHTFFEMLGNFSFGDYFKEGAIEQAWKLVTEVYGIPKDKLGVTVYHTDDEAFDLWKKIAGLPESKILRIPTKDNFWAMGDTGPCGPCSEIFYDHGVGEGEWKLDTTGHDLFGERYVEIWNLVFMQFEQQPGGEMTPLPKPSIDTGSGLERVAAVLQGVHDNYDTDLFKTLIRASESLTSTKAEGESQASHRVIADHLRACSFLIADGVLPSNEGRGYVLRRIMRRAMRHAHLLGSKEPLMHRLVPALIEQMGGHYGELERGRALITETLRLEEERFRDTLARGLRILDEEIAKITSPTGRGRNAASIPGEGPTLQNNPHPNPLPEGEGILPGSVAFQLYDTFGFPLDLTQDILRGRQMQVDLAGFESAMAEQKQRARAAWSGSGGQATDTLWFDLSERVGSTEFLGYNATAASGKVMAIIRDGTEAPDAKPGEEIQFVVNQTPFYAESGGQTGDTGWIVASHSPLRGEMEGGRQPSSNDRPSPLPLPEGGVLKDGEQVVGFITDTKKPRPDFHVHSATLSAPLKVGQEVRLVVDSDRRMRIRANHSATHILHAVLRRQLGGHITQKGSLVAPDRLRFDISHPKALTDAEIVAVEAEVNRIIWQNDTVNTRLMGKDAAIEAGAMAMFGEKYDDEVRVLSMGIADEEGRPYSIELCGGTHVSRTGDIGLFKIIAEGAVAAGIRRIEALTRDGAFDHLSNRDAQLRSLARELKTGPEALPERIAGLQANAKKLEKELAEAKRALAMGGGGSGGGELQKEEIGGIAFASRGFDGVAPGELRQLANDMLQQLGSGVLAIGSNFEGKASLIIAVSKDLTDRVKAPDLIGPAVEAVGGKGGGGRPEMAQGGGPDGDRIGAALAAVKAALTA